jgi:hypothetical protein
MYVHTLSSYANLQNSVRFKINVTIELALIAKYWKDYYALQMLKMKGQQKNLRPSVPEAADINTAPHRHRQCT